MSVSRRNCTVVEGPAGGTEVICFENCISGPLQRLSGFWSILKLLLLIPTGDKCGFFLETQHWLFPTFHQARRVELETILPRWNQNKYDNQHKPGWKQCCPNVTKTNTNHQKPGWSGSMGFQWHFRCPCPSHLPGRLSRSGLIRVKRWDIEILRLWKLSGALDRRKCQHSGMFCDDSGQRGERDGHRPSPRHGER